MEKISTLCTGTKEFSEALKKYSETTKLTIPKIAAIFGDVDPSAVSRAMNGKRIFAPEMDAIKRIAQKIGFDGEVFEPLNQPLPS